MQPFFCTRQVLNNAVSQDACLVVFISLFQALCFNFLIFLMRSKSMSHYIGSLRCSFDIYRQLLGTESIHPGPNNQHCASGKVRRKKNLAFSRPVDHTGSVEDELHNQNWSVLVPHRVSPGRITQLNWSVLVPHRVSPGQITQLNWSVLICSTQGQSRTNYTIRIGLYLL